MSNEPQIQQETNQESDRKLTEIETLDPIHIPQSIIEAIQEDLPVEEQGKVVKIVEMAIVSMKQSTSYSGPTPHPDILRGYEELYPGSAKHLIDNAITQSDHRRYLESTHLKRTFNQSCIGQIFAFIIALSFLIGSIFLIHEGNGKEIYGTVLGTVDLVALVYAFIRGKESAKEDLKDKRE